MNSKILAILILFFFFFLGILLGPFFSNFFEKNVMPSFSFLEKPAIATVEPVTKKIQPVELSPAEIEQINKDFPDKVSGVITLDDFKTKITTTDGKEYQLWAPQPNAIYQYMGVENNQKVEVQGKFLEGNKLQWRLIK